MTPKRILLTGGAGFIGSNITKALLKDPRVEKVRVLDNLSTGSRNNIRPFLNHPKFEFMWGDITDFTTCMQACRGVDLICHQAALGSVPRSIKAPLTTNNVNITGTLNIFTAAMETGIKRVVYAASSSTYGDSRELPKREESIGKPISPYAVTKLVNELYARVFGQLYGIEFFGLRYFNVFGPNQDPDGAYAAVIPLFVKAVLENRPPTINGNGEQSRDFTYVDNAVQANIKALFTTRKAAVGKVYNIAVGQRTTIKELYEMIRKEAGSQLQANHGPTRMGDVQHSLADISRAQNLLGYQPEVTVAEGVKRAFAWYKNVYFQNMPTIDAELQTAEL